MLARRHPHRPLAGFALLTVCIYTTALAIVFSPVLARAPGLMSGAITFDLLVAVPLLYWFLLVRTGLAARITLLPVFVMSVAAAHAVLPPDQQGWLSAVALLAIPAEAALVGIAAWKARAVVRRMRGRPHSADALDAFRDALDEVLGSPFAARVIASESGLAWYAFFSWRARPRVAQGEIAFSNDRRTGAAGLLFGLAVATVVEMAVVHVLLAPHSTIAAWIVTIISAYTLLWLLGFARALRLNPVTIGAEHVRIRVGALWDVTLPYAAIEAVEDAPRTPVERRESGYLNAAFVGTPQTILTLAEPVDVHGIYGIRRRGVRRIGVYVDEPARFRDELRARIAAAR